MKLPVNEAKLVQFNGMEGALEVEGEIIRVAEKKSGEGEFGPWSFQKVIIKDADGEATLSLKNREETLSPKDVGKTISICSNETKKGGHKGVKVENREFKKADGTTAKALEIVVTGHASLDTGNGAHPSHDKVMKSIARVEVAETIEQTAARLQNLATEEAAKWDMLRQLRKDSIQETFTIWLLTLMESKIEITPEVAAALIRVCGPNADTLMLSKIGRK